MISRPKALALLPISSPLNLPFLAKGGLSGLMSRLLNSCATHLHWMLRCLPMMPKILALSCWFTLLPQKKRAWIWSVQPFILRPENKLADRRSEGLRALGHKSVLEVSFRPHAVGRLLGFPFVAYDFPNRIPWRTIPLDHAT